MRFLTTLLAGVSHYQLISGSPIQNFFTGKSSGEMSVMCNRKELTVVVMQCSLWFLNLWPKGWEKVIALYF